MTQARLLIPVALLLGMSAILYWSLRSETDHADESVGLHDSAEGLRPNPDTNPEPGLSSRPELNSSNPIDDCLTVEMLESHPMFASDAARLDPVLINSPTIASYRGLSIETLTNLAIQDDSAAMAVLGAIWMLKAIGIAEQYAVPFLLYEDIALSTPWEPSLEDPDVQRHLKVAREWFYKSALHGRLFALYRVGEIDAKLGGGPVGLGWIDKSQYEDFRAAQRSALMPQNVYNLLAFEIAPQLRTGTLEIIYDLIPKHEYQGPILEDLATQFEQDRLARKLPPIVVPESQLPTWEEIREMICEGALDLSN